jgi:2-haloalkanoic acid dehalogenase type II
MKLRDFRVLTLDCYGTLIDWETGLTNALAPLVRKAGLQQSRDGVLEQYAEQESAQQNETPAMPYSELLSVVYGRLARKWGVPCSREEAKVFGASIPDWPAFDDSVAALAYLKQHFKLVILSNVDRASFRASNERLQVAFDAVYTAQDIGSYKPNPQNFAYLLRRLKEDFGFEKSAILHVAESLWHDHGPAQHCGLASAWIHRRHGLQGSGATKAPQGTPKFDYRFDSMAALVQAHCKERGA